MKLNLFAGLVAGFIALTPAAAEAAPASVTVRVEGATQTLLESTPATTSATPVVKDGHNCSGTSAGGALDKATNGNWQASYSSDYNDFFITAIMGETPPGTGYWSLWINHRYAQAGACSSELQAGDDVLFLSDRCDIFVPPSTCSDQVFPLGLSAPATVTQGSSAQVTVVRYDADGNTAPVSGASVGGAVTDAAGHATVSFPTSGVVALKAEKTGFARSEAKSVAVSAPGAATVTPATVVAPDKTPPTRRAEGHQGPPGVHVRPARAGRQLRRRPVRHSDGQAAADQAGGPHAARTSRARRRSSGARAAGPAPTSRSATAPTGPTCCRRA